MKNRFFEKYLYNKIGEFKLNILKSPIFIVGLFFKLIAAYYFAGDYFVKLFVPFLKYYSLSGLQNPYQHFFDMGMDNIFPYPSLMLYIMAFPGFIFKSFLRPDVFDVSNFEILIYRLPIILADIIILIVLARWLKGKEKEILYFYWLSPILFYINYINGQLDVVPIMLVFVFLYLLFKEKWLLSFVFLGLATTAKTNIFTLLPFAAVYVWKKNKKISSLFLFFLIIFISFIFINNIHLLSLDFQQIVFNNEQQSKIFDAKFNLTSDIFIYLIPFAYLLLFFHSLSFKVFNRDIFIMFLGFAFGILTFLIPPMPGWYYWVIPFLIYFYIKNKKSSKLSFWGLNLLYFLYFITAKDSDFLQAFHFIRPNISSCPSIYYYFSSLGLDVEKINNIIFSSLQAMLFLNIFWVYKKGVESNKKNKIHYKPYLIGLAGDSGSGKTTFANLLCDIFANNNLAIVAGDDMHKWERGNKMWEKYTHLNPKANKLHLELNNAIELKEGNDVHRSQYDHASGRFTLPKKMESKKIVIFDGLHSFFLGHMRNIMDLKIFIKPEEQLRRHWKIRRDINDRGHKKEKVLKELKKREADSENFINIQEQYSDIVISFKNKKEIGENIGSDIKLDIFLEIKCPNDINFDLLLDYLSDKVEIDFKFDDKNQIFRFFGKISENEIEKISYYTVPELYDVLVKEPKWSSDYNGLMQIFLCYYIFKKIKINGND